MACCFVYFKLILISVFKVPLVNPRQSPLRAPMAAVAVASRLVRSIHKEGIWTLAGLTQADS